MSSGGACGRASRAPLLSSSLLLFLCAPPKELHTTRIYPLSQSISIFLVSFFTLHQPVKNHLSLSVSYIPLYLSPHPVVVGIDTIYISICILSRAQAKHTETPQYCCCCSCCFYTVVGFTRRYLSTTPLSTSSSSTQSSSSSALVGCAGEAISLSSFSLQYIAAVAAGPLARALCLQQSEHANQRD